MKKHTHYLIFVVLLGGCMSYSPRVDKPMTHDSIQISGNIVNQAQLERGGKLAFTDLKAGPLAIADEQTDKLSLKIIQGVTSVLSDANGINISIANDPHDANFIFEGYIEEFTQPGKFSKFVLLKKNSRISVSGEIYDRKTGLRIISFASSKIYKTSKDGAFLAALKIGESIGQFIRKHASKEEL